MEKLKEKEQSIFAYFKNFNSILRDRFGCRVYKISLDGGFTCPNRDGTKGYNGCIFCDATGSSSRTNALSLPLTQQIENNLKIRKSRYRAKKFIAYFQSFTNTYASCSYLKTIYDIATFSHPDIIGLSVATRSDCIDEKKLALIAKYKKHLPYVCVEYGLQTIHDKTLDIINRKETFSDFLKAYKLTKQIGLEHCVHIILGLPNETYQDMLSTATTLAALGIDGIKIHILVAMKNTYLAKMYEQKKWTPLSFENAISLCCDFLERLPPSCVIHRIGGNGHPLHTLAPIWVYNKKKEFIQEIIKEFQKRKTKQGSFFKNTLKKNI